MRRRRAAHRPEPVGFAMPATAKTSCRRRYPPVCTAASIGYEGAVNAPIAPALHPPGGTNSSPSLLEADHSLALLWLLLLGILALRIVGLAVSNAELYFDEAQYWAWAQEPDFGYYTKPPLIAWIIGATTALCGDTPFCVRLPSPLIHMATSFVIYAIAAKLHSRRVAFWAALVYALLPGTSISATLMSTDVPLLLFWSMALLALVHHVERPSLAAGLALGAAIGLGLNAKYAMAFSLACYAVYAAVSPKARASLKHPGTWAALLLGASADRAQLARGTPSISSRPSSTRVRMPTGAIASRICSGCWRSSERRSRSWARCPSRPSRLQPGPIFRRRSRAAAPAARDVAAGLRADLRAGADLQGKRQLGGDRLSGRGCAGGGGHGGARTGGAA